VVNRLVIKPGKMNEFIDAQRHFGLALLTKPCGLSRPMYRSIGWQSAVLVSQFESESAQEELRQSHAFKEHLNVLQSMVESAAQVSMKGLHKGISNSRFRGEAL